MVDTDLCGGSESPEDAAARILSPILRDDGWAQVVHRPAQEQPGLAGRLAHGHTATRVAGNRGFSHGFQDGWRTAMSTEGAVLTDSAVDDFFDLTFRGAAHTEMCVFLESNVVPAYRLFSAVPASRWSRNMTQEFFGWPADSAGKLRLECPPGPRHVTQERPGRWDRQLRLCARRIRVYLEKSKNTARRISVFPVVHAGHFWLYIVNYDYGTIEYYNSMPAYLYTARSGDARAQAALSIQSPAAYLDYLGSRSAGPDDRGSIPLTQSERASVVAASGARGPRGPSDVSAFGAGLVWFFRNYVGRSMRILNFCGLRQAQRNGTDCGPFVCAYAYSRLVLGQDYQTVLETVAQGRIPQFRRFMRLMVDTCFTSPVPAAITNSPASSVISMDTDDDDGNTDGGDGGGEEEDDESTEDDETGEEDDDDESESTDDEEEEDDDGVEDDWDDEDGFVVDEEEDAV